MAPPPVSEVEDIIVGLIESKRMFASVDKETNMVCFHDDPCTFLGRSTLDNMTRRMQVMADLAERIRCMDADVTLSKGYVHSQVLADERERDVQGVATEAASDGLSEADS